MLEANGFSVTEESFVFSGAIGRWMVPVVSGVLALSLGAAAFTWRQGGPVGLTGAALTAVALVVMLASVAAARRGVLDLPVARVASMNLVATRGVPERWVVAHLDSKSQPMPTLARASLLVLLALSLASAVLLALLAPRAAISWWAVPLVGTVAGLVLSLATVGNLSPGAVDNATGVATVLRVAEQLPAPAALGIVLTSGEELGLAGMRAWARTRGPGVAINLDTLDDEGNVRCMVHGRRAAGLASEVVAAAGRTPGCQSVRVTGLLPGLLTDGVALADAGWQCVTISRGSVRTLARIHRPHDTVGQLTGNGVELGSRLLLALLTHRT